MQNPYLDLPERAFWKPAIAARSVFDIRDVWKPRFPLSPTDVFVTFGSCFAQHIGRALSRRGFSWHSAEPAPEELSSENAKRFNYDIFSARTGNIYTTSILEQWTRWALGVELTPDEFWERDGRVFDPFRPAIEPNGFASVEEMQTSRGVAVAAFRGCIEKADVFVFTLGLTESWRNRTTGQEYPMCPGTVAGDYDPASHTFENLSFARVSESLDRAMELMKSINPNLKFLLTVSPVPLTATNGGEHVMVATMESKSILRTVAGQIARSRNDTDYFPSYELINSPAIKGVFFQPNQRDVNPRGVDYVMDHFFSGVAGAGGALGTSHAGAEARVGGLAHQNGDADVVCEEELLQAFGETA